MGERADNLDIHFRSDGLALSPEEYANLLARLAEVDGIAADEFSRDGAVARLEERMAALLGKETALFLPSGTLANHLALRVLAPLPEILFPQQSSRKGAKAAEKNRKVRPHSFVGRGVILWR